MSALFQRPPVDVRIEPSWKTVLENEFAQDYFHALIAFIKQERREGFTLYPPGPQIFHAFDLTPFEAVKVVILGQDPYIRPGQAHGLCFSVPTGQTPPPSLRNIYKELHDDLSVAQPPHGNLEKWARQGVLLLNAILTVRAGQSASHQQKGWERFTDAVIDRLNQHRRGLVFLLWGSYAQAKGRIIDTEKHHVLRAAHPSPLSAQGFFGCRHFSKTNDLLAANGLPPIDWQLDPV